MLPHSLQIKLLHFIAGQEVYSEAYFVNRVAHQQSRGGLQVVHDAEPQSIIFNSGSKLLSYVLLSPNCFASVSPGVLCSRGKTTVLAISMWYRHSYSRPVLCCWEARIQKLQCSFGDVAHSCAGCSLNPKHMAINLAVEVLANWFFRVRWVFLLAHTVGAKIS